MSEAQFEVDTSALKRFLEIPSIAVDKAILRITEDGLKIRTVDPGHVVMIDIELNDLNSLDLENDTEIRVNINQVLQFLKLVDDDTVDVTVDGALYMETEKYNNPGRKIPRLDEKQFTDPSIPDLNLPNEVSIKGSQFKQAVKSGNTVSDHIALRLDKNGFQATAEEHEQKINLNLTSTFLDEIKADESVRCLMALDHLNAFQKKIGKSDELKIRMGNDYPIKITWNYTENNECLYLQAPRIES